jgi:translation initiation factor IF-2
LRGQPEPEPAPRPAPQPAARPAEAQPAAAEPAVGEAEGADSRLVKRPTVLKKPLPKVAPVRERGEPRRRQGKLTITQALDAETEEEKQRSLASVRRQREKLKALQAQTQHQLPGKVLREVVIPETITVQELANRMAERGGEVIKTMMRMGVMATINQVIDADTAELVVAEFGHKFKRVSAADVEVGLKADQGEEAGELRPRPPIVTIMGHVDHGKTSLLDALRHTDVAAGEAGGITQHIGAYQVQLPSGQRISFIDTPGHAAFTAMRARGATVTDIVVLVVAGDDGIMEQTVEAIAHARSAGVPLIVAINKMDKPGADATRVKRDLLQHNLATEDMGGDVLAVEVSAKTHAGLDKLEEAILLQAELLDLKANPHRPAEGVVIESKLDKGRGSVATVLVRQGTLRVGDIFIAGAEWGRVRALVNDRKENLDAAPPGTPVEVLGLQGTPVAGDDLLVVENEARAREVVAFRQRKAREKELAAQGRGTLEQMLSKIREGEAKAMPVVIKSDVHGSMEAIAGALEKLGNAEVKVQVLHAGVGAISESDVTLARAAGALIIGFNVRANPQARDQARRDGVDIRYYSIIYEVVDEVKAALTGMLSPEQREKFLGYAEIREVFDVTRVGKVAGCMVTEGTVKRGARVRLLRDNVVIHDGVLKTLRRFKDEVREVQSGYECGMAFENYTDIKQGDRIECYEVEQVARGL